MSDVAMETSKESPACIPPEKNSLLIGEVRKFPSLYDTSDPNYYVLAERNKAWLQVAENCDLPAELCHLRWKSLRKRYAKEKRKFPEILQGHRRPWALFPKMSFLTPATVKRRIKHTKPRKRPLPNHLSSKSTNDFKLGASDDDMLIVDDNDEIVRTCKSVEMSEEDEYIYETLDDPDSALEIMKGRPAPKVKPTAIRSGGPINSMTSPFKSETIQNPTNHTPSNNITVKSCPRVSSPIIRTGGSGRIRKVTPKMQNSIIAKKLKQAQQVLHQSNGSNEPSTKTLPLQQRVSDKNNKSTVMGGKTVLYEDKTTRHVATVNPNIIRVEKIQENSPTKTYDIPSIPTNVEPGSNASEGKRPFKVVKVKGRNPIIFSPEQLPEIQSFLKSEGSPAKEKNDVKSPVIKIKSVDNLNSQNIASSSSNNDASESSNLDIIHSVGLMRKNTTEKITPTEKICNQSYARSYSWNRPTKVINKQTAEKTQADSQTNGYELEEAWNDIKEEHIDDTNWSQSIEPQDYYQDQPLMNTPDTINKANIWNRVNEAKLEMIAYQRKLLEEQHKKNLEYMKKEHDLKMTLLKAEIDLKRKQLNIML